MELIAKDVIKKLDGILTAINLSDIVLQKNILTEKAVRDHP